MRVVVLAGVLVLVAGSALAFELVGRGPAPDPISPGLRLLPIDERLFAGSPNEPTFGGGAPLESQLCTQGQYASPALRRWVGELKEDVHFHCKQWEYAFILQAINERGLMAPGKKGLGFGVGQEPLPSVFAKYGAEVLATDLDLDAATKTGWAQSDQHMTSREVLNQRGIVSDDELHRLVKTQNVDMTHMPDTLRDFDFAWSTCALGHLGNLDLGLQFIENSLKTLKPGGVAVHTTEINLSSDTTTYETPGTSVYRKHDIEQLVQRLTAEGHEVHVNFNIGTEPLDRHVDERPYTTDQHLRLRVGRYAVTSLGIVIRKSTLDR